MSIYDQDYATQARRPDPFAALGVAEEEEGYTPPAAYVPSTEYEDIPEGGVEGEAAPQGLAEELPPDEELGKFAQRVKREELARQADASRALATRGETGGALAAVERIVALGRRVHIELPEETEALWDVAVELENRSVVTDAQRGLCYLALKERLPHGEFVAELKGRGIAAERAREAMRIASLLLRLGDENSNRRLGADLKPEQLVNLPKKKLLALASVPPETLEAAVRQGELELDDVALMPVGELQRQVRALRYQARTLELEKGTLQQKQAIAEHQLATSFYSPRAVRVREEALHSQAAISLAIGQLDATLSDLMDPLGSWKEGEQGTAERGATASLLAIAIGAAAGELGRVVSRFRELVPGIDLQDVETFGLAGVTAGEARKALEMRDALLSKAQQARGVRDAARAAEGPALPVPGRGAGRPKGAADKAPRKGRS
jgi:hypothetical protein